MAAEFGNAVKFVVSYHQGRHDAPIKMKFGIFNSKPQVYSCPPNFLLIDEGQWLW